MRKASKVTINDLIAELDSARLVAGTNGNATAMISATMSKAKLLGLEKGDTTPTEPMPVKVTIQQVDARRYTDEDVEHLDDGSFYIKTKSI